MHVLGETFDALKLAGASIDDCAPRAAQTPCRVAQPGDLGRAVVALEDTLTRRRSDAKAEATLATAQNELSCERSKRGSQSLLARSSLGRAFVRLAARQASKEGGAVRKTGTMTIAGTARRYEMAGTLAVTGDNRGQDHGANLQCLFSPIRVEFLSRPEAYATSVSHPF